ncbi:MAG: VCBS repeat-containing protein [Planctomycetota bacterium]
MHKTTSSLPLRAAVLALLGGAASADGDTPAAQAHLAADAALIGGTVNLTLRSQQVGAQGFLAFGLTSTPIPLGPGFPVLLVGFPFTIASGTIGADGRFIVPVPIAPAYPPGVEVFAQGSVLSFLPAPTFFGSDVIRLAPGGAQAPFAPTALPAATELHAAGDVDWMDIDLDGRNDVFVANGGTGSVPTLLVNGGAASFTDEAALRLPAEALVPLSHVEGADVDSDGDIDLLLTGGMVPAAPAPNQLVLNDGSGFFTTTAFPAGAGLTADAEFGDVDGDGDPDVVIANTQDQFHLGEVPDGVGVFFNTQATFASPGPLSAFFATDPHGSGGSVTLGDADNDGDLDLFVARADSLLGGVQNQLFENDGTGTYTDITPISVPVFLDNSLEAEFADVNGDGLLDLFVANSTLTTPTAIDLLINFGVGPTGSVGFGDGAIFVPLDLGPATKIRLGLDVADVEGDGDPDVLIAIHQLFDEKTGFPAGDAVLLLNQGGAQGGALGDFLTDSNFDLTGQGFVCSDVSFGDADQDGDPDIYLGNSGTVLGGTPSDVLLLNGL